MTNGIKAFSSAPHFDDFDENKNFHRILIRAGKPVQARELNQMQTILQDQIAKSASFSFRNGARIINGEAALVEKLPFITVNDVAKSDVTSYLGANVVLFVSSARVLEATIVAAVEATGTDPHTFYLKYKSINQSDNVTGSFQPAQTLIVEFVDQNLADESVVVAASGNGMAYSVNEGVYYFKGNFVKVQQQFAIVNKYSNAPTDNPVSVGFLLYETVVTAEDDDSLYDNALGSSNESAPGAHRYRVQAFLTTKAEAEAGVRTGLVYGDELAVPDAATDVANYYELAVIKNGVVQVKPRQDDNTAVLEQTLARRTFDQSGDFIVDDFLIDIGDHLNTLVNKSGTYSQTMGIITVTIPNHGVQIGDTVKHVFSSGEAISDDYVVLSVDTLQPLNKYTIAARGIQDTSGDVSISYGGNRGLYLPEQGGSEAKLAVTLDKGKAYVRGFEIETLGNTYLDLDKARSTTSLTNQIQQLQFNQAFFVYSANAPQNLANPVLFSKVSLRDNANVEHGTAFVRGYKYFATQTIGGISKYVYRLDVVKVQFNNGFSFADVTKIYGTNNGTPFDSTVSGYIANSKESVGLFDIPNGYVKNYTPSIVIRNSERAATTVSSAGQPTTITFTAETAGETFLADVTNFSVYVVHSGGRSGIPQSVTLSNGNKTATLDITNLVGTNLNGATASVVAKTFKTDAAIRSKTLTTINPPFVTPAAQTIVLPNTDIYKVLLITTASGQIVTDFYALDNGQRDDYYGPGVLTLKNGFSAPSGNLNISYSYFAHGSGDFFAPTSYTNLAYDKIPTYVDSNSRSYFLGQAVDWRLSSPDANTMSKVGGHSFAANEPLINSVEVYLPRNDRIVLNRRGEFQIIKGVPSVVPELPPEPVDAITLYTLALPAYTFSNRDIAISKTKHQLYTMKDISKIVTRLENVENTASLSLLETKINSRQELNKFRNGFFVDNFSTQTAGMFEDPYHTIGYDFGKQEIRPTNFMTVIDLESIGSTGLRAHSDGLVTLDYTEIPFAKQSLASQIIRLQPYTLSSFIGEMNLVPSSDSWFDNKTVNTFQDEKAVLAVRYTIDTGRLSGTIWDFLGGIWTNVKTSKRATTQERTELESVIRNRPNQITNNQNSSTTTVTTTESTSAVPYIRSRLVQFSAKGLKPFNRVYLKFDGIDISRAAGLSEATIGQNLIVSGSGNINGVFRIPNDETLRFLTGKRRVVLSDIPGNNETYTDTVCDTFYEAAGTTITTTNKFVTTRSTVRSVRVYDPVAQSFFVKDDDFKEGVFISSIDVYFGPDVNPTTNTDSVRLELRNMINGYPGPDIPENGKVTVEASQIFGSKDASVATNFKFRSPVYLEDGNEYCFVLISNSETINVWSAVLGQKNVVAGETTPNSGEQISKQPYLGSLFISQNNTTWSPEQTQDLKFTINRCKFQTNGSINMQNLVPVSELGKESDSHTQFLDNNPFEFVSGSNQMRVYAPGHGFRVGDFAKLTNNSVTAGNIGTISYNGVPASQIYSVGANNPNGLAVTAVDSPVLKSASYSQTTTTITVNLANTDFIVGDTVSLTFTSGLATSGDYVIASVTSTNFTVTSTVSQTTSGNVNVLVDAGFGSFIVATTSSASANGRNGGIGNKANRVLDYSTLRLISDALIVNGTAVSYQYRSRKYSNNAIGTFLPINPDTQLDLPEQAVVNASGEGSLTLQAALTTSKDSISPVIDNQRVKFAIQKNLVNNVGDRYNGKRYGAAARYVQRPVTVVNPSNHLDVYVDLNLPNGTTVEVYYRTGQSGSLTGGWTKLPLATGDSLVNNDDPTFFRETKFSTNGIISPFFVSQIKIVLLSSDRTRVPRIKNFRSIVLSQI